MRHPTANDVRNAFKWWLAAMDATEEDYALDCYNPDGKRRWKITSDNGSGEPFGSGRLYTGEMCEALRLAMKSVDQYRKSRS